MRATNTRFAILNTENSLMRIVLFVGWMYHTDVTQVSNIFSLLTERRGGQGKHEAMTALFILVSNSDIGPAILEEE